MNIDCQTKNNQTQIQNFNNSVIEWIDHRKGLICLKNKTEHQTSNNSTIITKVFHIKDLCLTKPERRRLRKGETYTIPQITDNDWEIL